LAGVTNTFGPFHAEPTKSQSAHSYVWKEDTRVHGTQFELGQLPISRKSAVDWEEVRRLAKLGELDSIPADIYCRNYNSLKRIATVSKYELVGLMYLLS